jgi:hypothetical protein
MATSDGIADDDWKNVEVLAAAVADATSETESPERRTALERLMCYLDELKSRYGPRPSILATVADFSNDNGEAIRLLESVYHGAEQSRDARNMTFIASSLAQRYVEDLSDFANGRLWVDRLRQCLKSYPDSTELEVLSDLETRLSQY